jgi:hypothetical protein
MSHAEGIFGAPDKNMFLIMKDGKIYNSTMNRPAVHQASEGE